jgi:DNA-directed RNA polymerase subunit beta
MSWLIPSPRKKRIRKSFAKRASVLPVPYLLATQINSYAQFLQADEHPDKRKTQGLQAAFHSIYPIVEPLGQCATRFRQLSVGYSALRCEGMPAARLTFALPLRAKVRLTIMDKEAAKPTDQGGQGAGGLHGRDSAHDHHRFVRHQRHRARHRVAAAPLAGVFFEHDRGKTHSSGKLLFSARIIPVPRLVAGLRVRSQGLTCTSASTAAARCPRPSC